MHGTVVCCFCRKHCRLVRFYCIVGIIEFETGFLKSQSVLKAFPSMVVLNRTPTLDH